MLFILLLFANILYGVFSEFQEISSFVNVNNANICGTTIKPKVRIKATGNIVLAASCQLQQVECEGGLLTINYNGQLSAHDLLLTNCELSVAGRLQLSGQLFLEASKVFFSDGATLVLNHVEMVSQSIMNAGIHILHVEDFILSDSRINCRSCTLSIAMLHFDKGAIIADNVSTSFPQCSNNLRKNYGGYHAGCGGQGECCPGGSMQPYGSLIYPDAMGMPGGTCTEKGGNGGGKIRLLVEDFIVLSPGVISARGGEPTGPGLGGGSGGSIYIATVCRDLEHITLDVRGGNAGSMANGQPSYGGSGGRISIMCSSGVVDPIWSNIMLEGGQNRASGPASYGAMGTYHLDDDFFDGYIYSGANNQIGMFWDVDTPHAPTFVYFDYSGSYRFYTETQSDIYLDCSPTSPGCTHSIKITMDMADDGTDAAIIVPATTSLNVPPWNVFYSRRTEPRHVNSSEDVCKLYYAAKGPSPSSAVSATPSSTNTRTQAQIQSATSTNTHTAQASNSSTSTKTLSATPTSTNTHTAQASNSSTSTKTLSATPTSTMTLSATPTSTKTISATPTSTKSAAPTLGPCRTTGNIAIGAGESCHYTTPVTLHRIKVSAGGSLKFSGGLIAADILATDAALFEIHGADVNILALNLRNTILTVGDGRTINVTTEVTLENSTIEVLGSLKIVAGGTFFMDSTSRINALGKGYTTPFHDEGGDRRGIVGSGGVHAGCLGTECALRLTNAVLAYGSVSSPILPGSAGTGPGAGAGGGAIYITCHTLDMQGSVDAVGAPGFGLGGGGAGGSILIEANHLADPNNPSFRLYARGGGKSHDSSHPGSGGRIAVKLASPDGFEQLKDGARYSVIGGRYTASEMGPPGTYYVEAGTQRYLTTSTTYTYPNFSSVFAIFTAVPGTIADIVTAPNTEMVISTHHWGLSCPATNLKFIVNKTSIPTNAFFSVGNCVDVEVASSSSVAGPSTATLVANTKDGHDSVLEYYLAHFSYEAWDVVSTALTASNTALANRNSVVDADYQQCLVNLTACLQSCTFPMFQRPTALVKANDTVNYRVIASKPSTSKISAEEAETAARQLQMYLSSLLQYPRANIVYVEHEVRNAALMVIFRVTVPASGMKAGECLESHLSWNS